LEDPFMPPEDPRPIERLLDRAGRAVQPTNAGWQGLPRRLAAIVQQRPWRWWWLAPAPLGVAAAIALFILFGGGPNSPISPPAARGGEPPPVKVERQDVELPTLSVAETEGETLYMPLLEKLGAPLMPNPPLMAAAAEQIGDSKRAFRPFQPPPVRKLTGQALVKDHRFVLNLQEGDNVVRFTEVAATIDPTSVRFLSNTDPEGTVVKEQNFEYDLVNADALLKRYIDRKIVCIFKDGHEVTGYLASHDENALVLTSEPPPPPGEKNARSTQRLTRSEVQAIRLNEVPSGLLVKPTLVWKLHTGKPGKHDTTLSYLCGHIKWEADYVAVVTPSEGLQPDLLDI